MAKDELTEYAARLAKLSDAELQKEADKLAKQRTETRLKQNAVTQQQDVRAAVRGLPEETQRIVKLGLAGGIGLSGESKKGAQA